MEAGLHLQICGADWSPSPASAQAPGGKLISSILRVGIRGEKLGFLLGQEVEMQACQVVKKWLRILSAGLSKWSEGLRCFSFQEVMEAL